MDTLQYIASVKAKLVITSDYALAKELKITRSYMSALSNGKEAMSNRLALRFAEILGKHPGLVLLDAERERAARAKDDTMKELWGEILQGFHAPLQHARSGRRHSLPR